MIDGPEQKGEMETIIKQSCELSEEAHSDFGPGGKPYERERRGRSTRGKLPTKFKRAVKLNASEDISSALEQELTRRFPVQLRCVRKAAAGPTVKTIANRMTYVTGENLRRYAK